MMAPSTERDIIMDFIVTEVDLVEDNHRCQYLSGIDSPRNALIQVYGDPEMAGPVFDMYSAKVNPKCWVMDLDETVFTIHQI